MLCCLPSQAAAGDATMMRVSYILIFMIFSHLTISVWFTQYKARVAFMTIITLRLDASITGGAPPYSYSWSVPDLGVIDQDRSITQMFLSQVHSLTL